MFHFLHIFLLRHALRFLDRIWLICFPQVSLLTTLCCCFLIISHIKFLFARAVLTRVCRPVQRERGTDTHTLVPSALDWWRVYSEAQTVTWEC